MQRSGRAFWSLAPPPPLLFVFLLSSQLSQWLWAEMLATQATWCYLLEFGMHATSILHALVNKRRTLIIILRIDKNFPWSVLLSTIEITSTCSKLKWNGKWFYCKVLNILMSIRSTDCGKLLQNCFLPQRWQVWCPFSWSFSGNMHARKRKTNYATITSFPWTVLLSNIAVNQSAH